MYLCINCNAPNVERDGDDFKCPKCGYTWNVAHEQANAAYLASQGRKPAEPMAGQPDAPETPEDALMKELGLTDSADTDGEGSEPAGVTPDVADEPVADSADGESDESTPPDEPVDDSYHINVRIEGDPEGETEIDSEVMVDVDDVLIRLEATTVPLLREMAEEHEVDLAGANLKSDVIDRLLESGKLTAVFAPDGSLIDVE